MPAINADAFLEALGLPSEHPYAQPEDIFHEDEEREWSVLSYFGSWRDSEPSTMGQKECDEYLPSPSWARKRHGDHGKANNEGVCARSSVAVGNRQLVTVPNDVSFLQEIKPCLVSMFHMNIILWAPLVILFCLKKIYVPCRAPLRELGPVDSSGTSSPGQTTSPNQKANYFITIPSLPSYSSYMPAVPSLTSLRKVTLAHNKQKRQTTTEPDQSNSFERLLLLLSAISTVSSFSAIFSIENKKDESQKPGPDNADCKLRHEGKTDGRLKGYHYSTSDISIGSLLSQGPFVLTSEWMAYVVALIFTSVLMNDEGYVLAFPQSNLVALHVFVIYIALKRFGARVAFATALPISAIALYIVAHQVLDLPTIEPGLYYDETNPLISEAITKWPVEKRTYDDGRGTPWMITGDTRTGLPFMFNKVPEHNFVRRWVPLPEEKEAVILDIAFPENMQVEDDKLVYLILHGINGNSDEGYVVDFVSRQVSQGNIVAVMVTRGLGDSPILGDNILHFSRISDVRAAAKALRNAVNKVSPTRGLLLAGVGYSMGAITLANYVAQSEPTHLDIAIAFSGALDTKQQVFFERSASLWQPFIAKAMRDTLFGRYSRQITRKLDQDQINKAMRASSLVEFDETFFVPYNNFESLDEYYSEMGALADYDVNGYQGRIANVSIPLLCVQSLDDPVGYWKTFHNPKMVSKSGSGNVVLLFTQTGGHVGWPLGWHPALNGWRWMSDVASSFAESVHQVRQNN